MMAALIPPITQRARGLRSLGWIAAGALAAAAGWLTATNLPLETPGPYSRENVERAVPPKFPGLAVADLTSAGPGDEFAYRITYEVDVAPGEAIALLHASRGWTASALSTTEAIELLYRDATGQIDYIARFRVVPRGAASTIVAEFSPLPMRLAPARS